MENYVVKYETAYCALVGIVALASLSLFITSFFLIPQRSDPARRGFIWLKIILILLFL